MDKNQFISGKYIANAVLLLTCLCGGLVCAQPLQASFKPRPPQVELNLDVLRPFYGHGQAYSAPVGFHPAQPPSLHEMHSPTPMQQGASAPLAPLKQGNLPPPSPATSQHAAPPPLRPLDLQPQADLQPEPYSDLPPVAPTYPSYADDDRRMIGAGLHYRPEPQMMGSSTIADVSDQVFPRRYPRHRGVMPLYEQDVHIVESPITGRVSAPSARYDAAYLGSSHYDPSGIIPGLPKLPASSITHDDAPLKSVASASIGATKQESAIAKTIATPAKPAPKSIDNDEDDDVISQAKKKHAETIAQKGKSSDASVDELWDQNFGKRATKKSDINLPGGDSLPLPPVALNREDSKAQMDDLLKDIPAADSKRPLPPPVNDATLPELDLASLPELDLGDRDIPPLPPVPSSSAPLQAKADLPLADEPPPPMPNGEPSKPILKQVKKDAPKPPASAQDENPVEALNLDALPPLDMASLDADIPVLPEIDITPKQDTAAQIPPAKSSKPAAVASGDMPALTIRFGATETKVPMASEIDLDDVVSMLLGSPSIRAEIVAYAGSSGGKNSGSASMVSSNRAKAVRDYLKQKGAPIERLSIRAMGDAQGDEEKVDIFYR